jgi:gluconate:H+ symporter, GntP family
MSGMPLAQAIFFLAAVIILILATQRQRLHPFLAIVAVASALGYVAGFKTILLGRFFGSGFSEMIYSPGLVIVAAALISGFAESTTASDRLMANIDRWRSLGTDRIAAGLGLVAGLGASPASAFALLTPLLRPIGGETAQGRDRATLALALALSGSHGLLWLTPVTIAATAILGAEWTRVALFGTPIAVVLAGFAVVFVRWPPSAQAAAGWLAEEPHALGEKKGGSPIILIVACAVPLVLLMVQSLGDLPSSPFGSGPPREFVISLGLPLILFLAGLGIMILGQPLQSLRFLGDSAWTTRIIMSVANILLIVCATGGLQRICQDTGMPEMFGERLLGWHVGTFGGVLVPFFAAMAMKTLQGSSLVAAITAAGMAQPLLASLGLDGESGKALAALAVGAGAMTVSHVNDEYFWLVADRAGLSPLRGVVTLSLGTLLQGLIAVALLLLLSLLVSHI